MNSNSKELLTVKEVASWLRLSLAEVYRLIRSGAVSHYRVGPGKGAIRLREADVATFLEARREGPRKPPEPIPKPRLLKHVKRKLSG